MEFGIDTFIKKGSNADYWAVVLVSAIYSGSAAENATKDLSQILN